jgi:hypothetical protein
MMVSNLNEIEEEKQTVFKIHSNKIDLDFTVHVQVKIEMMSLLYKFT